MLLLLVINLLIIFNIYNLSKLNNDFKILENFNIHKSPQFFLKASPILKNLAQNMSEVDGRYSFKSSSIEKIIEQFPSLESMVIISQTNSIGASGVQGLGTL